MDLFSYLEDYRTWICVPCGAGIKPKHYLAHLTRLHNDHPHLGSSKKAIMVEKELLQKAPIDPDSPCFQAPRAGITALPYLPLHNGVSCLKCPYVSASEETMRKHCGKTHLEGKRRQGRPAKTAESSALRWKSVSCQRLFVSGFKSQFFEVLSSAEIKEAEETMHRRSMAETMSEAEYIRTQIDEALEEGNRETRALDDIILDNAAQTEVSPWLEMTRWPKYLKGYSFGEVAPLASPADPTSEPILVEFSSSLDRIVEEAHSSICNDKVNVFDQARINSFIQKRRAFDRPLLTKLRNSTYQKYKQVYKRLLCFAFRTIQPTNHVALAHRLTASQLEYLDQMAGLGEELVALKQRQSQSVEDEKDRKLAEKNITTRLDRVCLQLCISLLDHTLKGDLFESTVVGFLAVLAVDPEKKIFRDASSFTSYLSAFVKISQMLVIQMSVTMSEDGEIEHPADVLDEMRERFLMHGTRSPFNWVLRLRAYGKRIRNSTTAFGYIYWSDDHEKLTYKQLEMTMADLKAFVKTEVALAQSELEQLFLLHDDERREDVIPAFELRNLKDDPTRNSKGWSFIEDSRNQNVLPNGKRWMLERVLNADELRTEFVEVQKKDSKVVWKPSAAKQYVAKIHSFLERLLLLVHLTAGQPARGTEVLSLRHCNTVNGHYRSIFIEDGLVSTVTAYHKGYNIVGSTKIIHRYLPKEVSELVVYYLWFILPFWKKLDLLVWYQKAPASAFLWPKGEGSWDSTRLTQILKNEAEQHLNTYLNITYYRHMAIAISRVHLKCGGFKRDYGVDEKSTNQQTTHTSWIAGLIYARGLEEAPGAVEARRTEYRRVSREWHDFLGFRTYLSSQRRPLSAILNGEEPVRAEGKRQKHSFYFQYLAEYRVAVCKECQYAVWPDQIEGHLQEQHKIKRSITSDIGSEIRSWAGIIQYPSEFVAPSQIVAPHPQLPVYADGLLCQLNPRQCQRVLRSTKCMKKHWHEHHQGWSAGKNRGRPSQIKQRRLQARMDQGYTRVYCQRLFGSRHGSQYFQVHAPNEGPAGGPAPVPVNSEAAWAQVGEQMAKAWENVVKRAQNTIQDGERDEVNPWLERTQWLPYLVGMERLHLLACIEEPVADPDPRKDEESEPVEAAIWAAMDGLARFSQASVIDRIGVFVRLEAIRTEKHQTRFQPLQPYMDKDAIVKHTRPWQQMLMFFARTQKEHTWRSPQYRFTRRQREAWEALVEQAERGVEGEEVDEEEVDEEEMDQEREEMDEMDEAMEVAEEEQEQAEHPHPIKPEKLSRIQKACLEFCIALMNQSITRKEYDSPLVCALAVLGVKEDGWKGPEQYPPILSAVIKVARFMVVQQALELSEPFNDNTFDSDSAYESDSSHQPQRRPKGCLQFVQEMMDKFMVRGSHGPMQWMLDLRTYGLKIHYNTTSRGHVEWTGGDELLYKGLQFNMAQFRGMVHGLATESRRLLTEELMFGNSKAAEPIPSVPWESMRDNPTDERPGWNFLKDHRTRMPVDGEKWLFERVGRDASVRERFMKPGSRSGINRQGVERYMDSVVQFREKIAALMHFVLGQPQRWPELASIRHSNTVKGGLRNMGIEDGMVYVATRYHKGYAISGDVKIIHRYLPREVGELVVWYLWLVLPFQQRLEAIVWEKEAISSHMWPADPNGRKWTSERFREALKRESRIGLGQELTIASYREIAIGISRRFLRKSTAFHPEEGDENEEWNEENRESLIADEQAGHTAHIAGMIYARGVMEQAGVVAEKRQQFRASSTDWHRFLGFQDVEEEKSSKKRKRAPFESEADEARIDRWGRLRKMDTTAQLKRMMSKTAEFRGVQAEAIQAIIAGESPVVAVMPTGGGKSLLFMLPAWAEQGGTTIVVIPLIALRGDMIRRCKLLGISCAAWEGRRPPDAAAVVLVTPESAVGEEFATFLNRLRATRQLDRIVIDECHVVLNRRYTFRKQMQQLGRLVAAETQMVMLTATLPPSEEDELFRRMHFDREQVKMFRARTTRTNVAYRVVQVDKALRQEEVEEVVVKMARRKIRQYKTGKTVIYGNSVAKVKKLAEQLACNAYFHDAVGKASMLADFMDGKQRVIVATSALGMGVDIPDIRCIIHIDWPRTILDYAQESGRAGRDGLRSEAVIIGQEGDRRACNDKQGEEEQGLVRLYAQGDGTIRRCRRRVLDEYLDGREGREGCEEGEEMCDVCRGAEEEMEEMEEVGSEDNSVDEDEDEEEEKQMGAVETDREEARRVLEQQEQERRGPRQTLIQQRQQEFDEVEWLRRQLAWWANRCGVCEAAGDGQSEHDVRQCRRPESRCIQDTIKTVEEQIKFERYSGCFWCGVPQEICNRWERNSYGRYQRTKDGDCQYRGVLIGGLWGIALGRAEVIERWSARLKAFGVGISGAEQRLVEFLGEKQVLETVESNHLVGEFCWVTRLIGE